jgi:hypothetical protein
MSRHAHPLPRLALAFLVVLPGVSRGGEPEVRPAGQTLFNGIRLPSPWPPPGQPVDQTLPTPPYLTSPPEVIPIDVGRQLLVDDFLVEHTTLRRSFHAAAYVPDNPVLRPDRPWEQRGQGPMAMVFSDGVWFDPHDRKFKMWYMGGYLLSTCLAVSDDGRHWTKPDLGVVPGTNIVQTGIRDSSTVWLDQEETDPARRYKMFRSHGEGGRFGLSLHASPDGIHWGERLLRTGSCGDRSTVFYNPFRRVWVYSLRHGWGRPRRRRYWETPDLIRGPQWTRIDEPPLWVGADRLDPMRADLREPPELYNLDAVAYESLVVGLFTIWRGDKNIPPGRPKPNEVCVGFSRDGFHWDRPDRRPFLPVSERKGDWNWGNVQSAGGCCLVVGDRLYFYVSGRAAGTATSRDARGSTGLALLRRDGFASLDADATGGELTTRPVRFAGRHLFVNVEAPDGELRVEVLDRDGQVIPSFTRDRCVPIRADRTLQAVSWGNGADLSAVAGRPVKFRFHLTAGRLYAFWVSPEPSGASHGYVAAGGPGFTGPTDTVGSAADLADGLDGAPGRGGDSVP